MSSEIEDSHEVRLFPSLRISNEREAELRATASLLAMVKAVSEFGRSIVRQAGGPKGGLRCFTEVSFKQPETDKVVEIRPDGIVESRRGKTEWRALVEVKVGDNLLKQEQLDAYHKLAKDHGFNAVITISNQAALPNGLPPVNINSHRLKAVPVTHFSWDRLLSEARVLSRRKEISDPDQHWMLDEWIRYVADPASRIIEQPHLGENWAKVCKAARDGHLAGLPKDLLGVVGRWDDFLSKVALRLRAKLGVEVQPRTTRAERSDPKTRIKAMHAAALNSATLSGAFRIPDVVGRVTLDVFLPANTVRYAVAFDAPTEGRPKTRLNWLLRQLRGRDLPTGLLIKVRWDEARIESQAQVDSVLEAENALLRDGHGHLIPATANPKAFSLEWSTRLAKPRGRSSAPILDGIATNLERFYSSVVEGLRPYVPRAPQLERGGGADPSSESSRAVGIAPLGLEQVTPGDSATLEEGNIEDAEPSRTSMSPRVAGADDES